MSKLTKFKKQTINIYSRTMHYGQAEHKFTLDNPPFDINIAL